MESRIIECQIKATAHLTPVGDDYQNPKNYKCWRYDDFVEYLKRTYFQGVPSRYLKFVRFDYIVCQEGADNNLGIYFVENDNPIWLGNVRNTYPEYADNTSYFLVDKSDKTNFYVVQYFPNGAS